jgi:hypothetical protein
VVVMMWAWWQRRSRRLTAVENAGEIWPHRAGVGSIGGLAPLELLIFRSFDRVGCWCGRGKCSPKWSYTKRFVLRRVMMV